MSVVQPASGADGEVGGLATHREEDRSEEDGG
jgi:hypothetical protein